MDIKQNEERGSFLSIGCQGCIQQDFCSIQKIIDCCMQHKNEQAKEQEAAIKIQSFIRGAFTRQRVKKLCRDLFKRKMIVKELLQTQQNYIRDLSVIISDFRAPLINKQIITSEQAQTIFLNIDQIRHLNQFFFASVFEAAMNYGHYKIIFKHIEKEVHFFKIYFQYFNCYTSSNNVIEHLTKERQEFADFINEARLQPHHRLLSLKDYLIKPVQRLPKYVLIMKQIKKRTPLDHPDFKNIERVLHLFQQVNQSNNDKLNRVLNGYKIHQIQKKLNLPHVISEPGVDFVLEEPVTVVTNDGHTAEGTLYLLNTELIVSRKKGNGRQIFLTSVPFKNGGGNIMSNQQHYFYKDTFTVQNCEGDSCMFLCNSEEEKENLIQKIYNQLMKAQQRTLERLSSLCSIKNKEGVQFLQKMTRLDLLPDVQILGTDEHRDNLSKYTVYIIEVRIKTIKQKLFLRFKQLLQLQEQIKREYGFNIKNQLLKTPWVTNHKPKQIQQRKISIQRFLKQILSKKQVIQNGEQILNRLGLPYDFYKLPEYFKASEQIIRKSGVYQRSTSDKSEEVEKSSLFKSKHNGSIFATIQQLQIQEHEKEPFRIKQRSRGMSIQDILKANQLHLGHFTRYTMVGPKPQKEDQHLIIDILIPWIQNEKGFVKQRLYMRKDQRVANLIENLSQQLELKYFKDFRLVLERQYAGRMLDDDQCLPKVMQEIKSGKYLLILKKMIYISPQIQEREIRGDRIRLKIIASQVVYECKKDKYLLDYQIILRLAVFVGISQVFADQEDKDQPTIQSILRSGNLAIHARNMITSAYTSFYDGPSTWKKDYEHAFNHILQKLKAISSKNSHVFRTSGIDNNETQFNTTQICQLSAISIITEMKANVFFGSTSFVVQISQQFRQFLRKFGEQDEDNYDNRNCWLIIKWQSMHLYSISLKTCIFSFAYDELYKMEPYPSSIVLHLRQREIDMVKLKTTNSYSIRQMLMYYKNYNDLIKRIDEDDNFQESMIELVKSQQNSHSVVRTFKQ